MLCYIVLWHVILYYVMLCCDMLCYDMLCYVMLRYIILCCLRRSVVVWRGYCSRAFHFILLKLYLRMTIELEDQAIFLNVPEWTLCRRAPVVHTSWKVLECPTPAIPAFGLPTASVQDINISIYWKQILFVSRMKYDISMWINTFYHLERMVFHLPLCSCRKMLAHR